MVAIPGWLIAVLAIGGVYLVYITITQPQAGMRIWTTIFMVIGRLFYFIGIALYRVIEAIVKLFSKLGGRRK
jgi:hypothetical protein